MDNRLFLSYARGDDEPFVERLYHDLVQAGFDVWWDRERMPNRALTFLQEIRDAVEESGRLVAVVGPAAVESDYVRAEWMHALLFAKGIVPLLRMGEMQLIPGEMRGDDYRLVPDELSGFHCPDFRAERPYDEAFAELLRILREPVPPLGPFLSSVPSLPPHFLPRPDGLASLDDDLLSDIHRPVVITSARQTAAVQGMPGIGKSVLAASFARSTRARRAFTDGILWLSIGQQPNVLRVLTLIGQAFGDAELAAAVDVEGARARLPRVLEPRVALLVLDDVWNVDHVLAVTNALGPRCRVLVTTRDRSIATSLGAGEHQVDVLPDRAANALLADWAGVPVDALPPAAREVVAECGNLPLALSLCGAMARDGTPWDDMLSALRTSELDFVEARLPNYEHRHVLRALQSSVDVLGRDDPAAVERYLELFVFHEDRTVPEAAVVALWSRGGRMTEARARKLLVTLDRKSLLRLHAGANGGGSPGPRTVSLHDLQYDYLTARTDDPAAARRALLDAYRERSPGGWWTGPADGYFHRALVRHLLAAEGENAARALLLEYRWLDAELRGTDVNTLLQDLARLHHDRSVRAVRRALRQAGHVLSRAEDGPGHLATQLLARLPAEGDPALARLRDEAAAVQNERGLRWLRPLTASLRTPPALLRTLTGHQGWVTCLALLPDGRLASGSEDTTIRVWNLDTGATEQTLAGHAGVVWSLALLPDGRLASGSGSGRASWWRETGGEQDGVSGYNDILIWDLHTARAEQTLAGHSDNVWALQPLPGDRLASASSDETIRVWDLAAPERTPPHSFNGGYPSALALLPDGRLASDGWGKVMLWEDLHAGLGHLLVDEYHGTPVVPMVALWDGRLAAGRHDNSIGVWTAEGSLDCVLEGHTSWVTALAALPSGRLASGAKDGSIRVWSIGTGEALLVLEGHSTRVTALAAVDGERLASASEDAAIKVWDLSREAFVRDVEKHERAVRTVTFLTGGAVASGSDDQTVRVWDAQTGALRQTFFGHNESVRALAPLSDGRLLSGAWDHSLRLWDLEREESVDCREVVALVDGWERDGKVNGLVVLPNGRVAGGVGDGTLRVWDAGGAAIYEAGVLPAHQRYVLAVALLADGRLASGSADGTIAVVDLSGGGGATQRLNAHQGEVSTLAVLRDERLAAGHWNGGIVVWDPAKWSARPLPGGHDSTVWALAPLPDGSLASGGRDRTLRVWSRRPEGWAGVVAFIADAGITALRFDEASGLLAAGDASGRIHLLRPENLAAGGLAREPAP